MAKLRRIWLGASVIWELARYDIVFASRGFRAVRLRPETRSRCHGSPDGERTELTVCEAFEAVAPFYWKPVRCLQRSIVVARLLRRRRVPAEVVIGYRPVPFFSHAWVEVGGRVVNDSKSFQRRLQVLERF